MSQHREYQRKGPRVNDGFQLMNKRPLPASPIGEEILVIAVNSMFINEMNF
jgi:hypothetical protein